MSTESRWWPRPVTRSAAAACPTDADLAAFLDDRLSPERHAAILQHVSGCSTCATVVGTVGRLVEQPDPGELPRELLERAAGLARRRTGVARSILLPAAAAACLFLAAAVWNGQRRADVETTAGRGASGARQADDTRSRSSATAPTLRQPPAGTVPAGPVPFAWTAVAGAVFYEVHVTTREGDVVWTATTESTGTTLDPSVRLEPGVRYFAWVSACLPDGRRVPSNIVGLQGASEP